MKVLLMTTVFIIFSIGFNKILKTSEQTGDSFFASTVNVLQIEGIVESSDDCKLTQQFQQSTESIKQSVKQTIDVSVDFIISIIAYVGLTISHAVAVVLLDQH